MRKKLLAITLSTVLGITLFTGCGTEGTKEEKRPDIQTVETSGEGAAAEDAGQEDTEAAKQALDTMEEEGQAPVEKEFTFQPKVSGAYMEEIFGKDLVEIWYRVVDAALAGEETFSCPDQDTYDWVMYQFPERCFPVLTQLIEPVPGLGGCENGEGIIVYKTSREEFDTKLKEFELLVEDILNQTMKKDYSDLEKALALYEYFTSHYEYDYDAYNLMTDQDVDYVSSYRLLTEGTGICQDIATAYSYLLMQAGVDATCMSGNSVLTNEGHEWSYVRINGNNYHIDPTYGLGMDGWLGYFMMTDEKRAEDYSPDKFMITSVYSQEHAHQEYVADDDTFSLLWDTSLKDFEHDTHIIHSIRYDDYGEPEICEFDYTGY